MRPGTSQTLFDNPWYSLATARYVDAAAGSDSNNGTSWATAWRTLTKANTNAVAGMVVYLRGAFDLTSGSGWSVTNGGNAATSTGYVVYRAETLLGATIRAASTLTHLVNVLAHYVVFDGLVIEGDDNNCTHCGITTSTPSGGAKHHIWVMNCRVRWCGQTGIQLNNSEYHYIFHNLVEKCSSSFVSGVYGSGISVYQPATISGYTPIAMDSWWDQKIVITGNLCKNNNNDQQGSGNTDGNGIIIDDWQSTQDSGGPNGHTSYTSGLIYNNLCYGNGGGGVHCFLSSGVIIAFNTTYGNRWDVINPNVQWRGEIHVQHGANVRVWNNIAQAVGGAGLLAYNSPFLGKDAIGTNEWSGNIAYGASVAFDSPDVYSTATNRTGLDPLFKTPGSGNFSLLVGSPAISYARPGILFPALPSNAGVLW